VHSPGSGRHLFTVDRQSYPGPRLPARCCLTSRLVCLLRLVASKCWTPHTGLGHAAGTKTVLATSRLELDYLALHAAARPWGLFACISAPSPWGDVFGGCIMLSVSAFLLSFILMPRLRHTVYRPSFGPAALLCW
jgi:hypothetical protein